jgi:hypothetical protein
MTSPTSLIVVALLVIVVAALLPVLYQMHRALTQTRAFLDSAGTHFERTLDQVGHTAERFDWIGERLEGPAQTLGPLFEMVSKGGHSTGHSEEWPRMPVSPGAALAPAFIAGVNALLPSAGASRGNDNGGDHSLSQIAD